MDILIALKQEKRELEVKLGRVEKAILAYGGEKKSKPAKANGNDHAAPAAPIGPTKMPDKIIAFLSAHGAHSSSDLAESLALPVGQVATTCSRLVRGGRLEKGETPAGLTVYSVPGGPIVGDDSPFKK